MPDVGSGVRPENRGGSRPVSRVLSGTVIHLGRTSPCASSDLPGDTRGPRGAAQGRSSPYLVLLRVGFTLPPALPSARCALTAPFHPYRSAAADRGGIFSVALAVGSRPPGVTWHPALWSPDFPPLAPLTRPSSDCPADSHGQNSMERLAHGLPARIIQTRKRHREAARDPLLRSAPVNVPPRPSARARDPARPRGHPSQRPRQGHRDTDPAAPSRRRQARPGWRRGFRAAGGDPRASGLVPRQAGPRGWPGAPEPGKPAGPAPGRPPGRRAIPHSRPSGPGRRGTGGDAPATRAAGSSATGTRTRRPARANDPRGAASLMQPRLAG